MPAEDGHNNAEDLQEQLIHNESRFYGKVTAFF